MAASAGGSSSGFGTVPNIRNTETAALSKQTRAAGGTGRFYNSNRTIQPLNPVPAGALAGTPRIPRTGKQFPGSR